MNLIHKKNIPNFILLDDDSWALAFTKEIIRGYNRRAEVISFTAANDAIEYIRSKDLMSKWSNTVFLTDLHMPEIDGFALLDRIEPGFNAMRDRLHIFVLSAAACPEEIKRVLSYNCVIGFLNKPFSKEKLEHIIECILFCGD